MNWLFTRRRWGSSLAALALLWAALAPSIGWAFVQPGEKNTFFAVCSSSGLQYVKLTGAEGNSSQPATPASNSMAQDCPYCQLGTHWAVLPAFTPPVLTTMKPVAPTVLHGTVLGLSSDAWRHPPAHAPPL